MTNEMNRKLKGMSQRLLTVKKAAGRNARSLQKEIANTQRLVEESVQSINRFARELDIHQQA